MTTKTDLKHCFDTLKIIKKQSNHLLNEHDLEPMQLLHTFEDIFIITVSNELYFD